MCARVTRRVEWEGEWTNGRGAATALPKFRWGRLGLRATSSSFCCGVIPPPFRPLPECPRPSSRERVAVFRPLHTICPTSGHLPRNHYAYADVESKPGGRDSTRKDWNFRPVGGIPPKPFLWGTEWQATPLPNPACPALQSVFKPAWPKHTANSPKAPFLPNHSRA